MSNSEVHRAIASAKTTRRKLTPPIPEVLAESVVGSSAQNIAAVAALLGGPSVLRLASPEPLEMHNAIVQGLPAATLVHLAKSLVCLRTADLGRALGVSERTIYRHTKESTKRLGPALGSRAWRFAELLVRATKAFGGQEEAERWLVSNVMGLDGQQPIALLQTSAGEQLVDEFLGRLEYGVYT